MKFTVLSVVLLLIMQPLFASGINQAAYRTMQMQAYQNRNRNYTANQPVPYWKAQSNFATRNRVYGSYSQYDYARQMYNNSVPNTRGYR